MNVVSWKTAGNFWFGWAEPGRSIDMGIYSPQERWKDGKTTRLYMINSKGNKVGKKKKRNQKQPKGII